MLRERQPAPAPLHGILPVLQISFGVHDTVDEDDLRREVDFCIDAGVHGLVVPALASEFMVLTDAERLRVVEVVLRHANDRVPVVVGVAGTSTAAAVAFSRHARANGAGAVMALPPYVRRPSLDGVVGYYAAIAAAAELPVVIQNAPPPLGLNLPRGVIGRLVTEIELVQYVKEERLPPGHHMSELLASPPAGLCGVFGGSAGLYLIGELGRGAIGCMPSAAFADVLVAIYALFVAGDRDRACAAYHRLLPALTLEMSVQMALSKDVLRRRGVFASTRMRDPEFPALDVGDYAELDALWPELSALFAWAKAADGL